MTGILVAHLVTTILLIVSVVGSVGAFVRYLRAGGSVVELLGAYRAGGLDFAAETLLKRDPNRTFLRDGTELISPQKGRAPVQAGTPHPVILHEPSEGGALVPKSSGQPGAASSAAVAKAHQQIGAVTRRLAIATPATRALPALMPGKDYGSELRQWEARLDGIHAHFFSRHGAHLTSRQLWLRANQGILPDNPTGSREPRHRDATKWISDKVQLIIMQEAERAFRAGHHANVQNQTNTIDLVLPSGFTVGWGFEANTSDAVSTNRARVIFRTVGGITEPLTAYPLLDSARALNTPWIFTSVIEDLIHNRLL